MAGPIQGGRGALAQFHGVGAAPVQVQTVGGGSGMGGLLSAAGKALGTYALGQLREERKQQNDAAKIQGQAAAVASVKSGTPLVLREADSDENRAFNAGAETAYVAGLQIDMRATAARLADESNRPEEFTQSWQAYSGGLLGKVPAPLRPVVEIEALARRDAGLSVVEQKWRKVELQQQAGTLFQSLDELEGDYRAAVRQGHDQRATELGDQANVLIDQMVTAGHISGAQAAQFRLGLSEDAEIQAVRGAYDKAVADGGITAGEAFVERYSRSGDGDPVLRDRITAQLRADLGQRHARTTAQDARLQSQVRQAVAQMDKGFMPDISALEAQAEGTAYASILADAKQTQDQAHAFAQQSVAVQIAEMTSLQTELTEGGLSLDETTRKGVLLERYQRVYSEGQKALAHDALSYGVAVTGQTLPPIEIKALFGADDDPARQALGQTIQQRVETADALAVQFGRPVLPFTANEIATLGLVVTQGTALEQTVMLRGLQEMLPAEAMAGMMTALAPKAPAFAVAADVSPQHPDLVADVLRGQERMTSTPEIAPPEKAFARALGEELGGALMQSPKTAAAYVAAGRALYTEYAAQEGDLSGDLKEGDGAEERLSRVVNDLTGGVVSWHGRKLISPIYGMDQDQFDTIMWRALQDSDLDGALTASGQEIQAADVRRFATFEGAAVGRYRVMMRDGYVLDAEGKPFELDLGAVVARTLKERPSLLSGEPQIPDFLGVE